jgi:hypothetical protein
MEATFGSKNTFAQREEIAFGEERSFADRKETPFEEKKSFVGLWKRGFGTCPKFCVRGILV